MAPPSTKRHILLIESDPALQTALQRCITLSGNNVTVAHSGTEAFKVLAAWTPDLIFLDISVPEAGLVVLRQLHEKYEQIKVIMLADATEVPQAQQALNYGASDYLSKPADLAAIKRILQIHLPSIK